MQSLLFHQMTANCLRNKLWKFLRTLGISSLAFDEDRCGFIKDRLAGEHYIRNESFYLVSEFHQQFSLDFSAFYLLFKQFSLFVTVQSTYLRENVNFWRL